MRRIRVTYELDDIRRRYHRAVFGYMDGDLYRVFMTYYNSHMSDTAFFILPAHRDLIWTIRTINER